MPKIPPISSRRLVTIAEKVGFTKIRQTGSHARYIHSDGRKISIPMHAGENIHPGLLRKILRDLQITPEDFSKLR